MLPNSPPGAVMLTVGMTKVPPCPDCWIAGLEVMLAIIAIHILGEVRTYATRTTACPAAFSAEYVALPAAVSFVFSI